MSGFDPDWLRLREPADRRARNANVLNAVTAHFADHDTVRILDIGCGLGSNFRALSPHLPAAQSWSLADHDASLLRGARDAICGAGTAMSVQTHCIDLATDAARLLDLKPDIVTAAAFFDLVSASWIRDFVAALKAWNLPLYAVLTYDGTEQWRPPHPADAAVLSAFHAHQAGNKGFGPAAGPKAHEILAAALRDAGYRLIEGDSPWRLAGAEDATLIAALAAGTAQAVRETGLLPVSDIDAWQAARAHTRASVVGHKDLFAYS
ncbi:SAM-dependent methyltransferase [Methylovirgula sp. 4M-Z18]|uniref:SAM-dependent methyltransferase n=1 Tax=Methylovirgula sp. 4M-Z18 TaxID=2293567 RepID=UPI000E2E843D|nr:SAM-dependent methyltransferase [Methylovirgula sp. 4M-Z18]RFB79325.1 SAM-dependent methyltransferase [Methylovirgula sp. 4M-Z18]